MGYYEQLLEVEKNSVADAVVLADIITEVLNERFRAIAKHGEQLDVPNGDDDTDSVQECPSGSLAKMLTDKAFQNGRGTWAHILIEEVGEALDELENPQALRTELIQVAQVAISWVVKLDKEQAEIS